LKVRYRSGTQSRPGNVALRVDFEFRNGVPAEGWYAFEIKAKEGYEFDVLREKCVVQSAGQKHSFDRSGATFKTSVASIEPAVDPQALLLPLIGGTPQFGPVTKGLAGVRVFSIQPKAIQELQEPDSGASLKSDGSNLSSVLKSLSREEGKMERLCELLRTVVPGTATVKPIKHGKKMSLEFRQEWEGNGIKERKRKERRSIAHEAFSMSDGTLRTLGILTAFLQRNRPTLVGLEEPEATIHPEALAAILEMIRSFSRDTQVLVTTHSPELLDATWIESENLRVVTWENGVTQVLPLGEASVARELSCPLVMANREYEAWFLASLEELSVSISVTYPNDPDQKRGAKEELERRLGIYYNELADQPKFTAKISLARVYRRSPSFRKLVKEYSRLLDRLGFAPGRWPELA
jgi:predicted ATPase